MVTDLYRTINSRIPQRPLSRHHHHAATVEAFKAAGEVLRRDGGRGADRRGVRLPVPRRPRRRPHAASNALFTCQKNKNITEKCFQIVFV